MYWATAWILWYNFWSKVSSYELSRVSINLKFPIKDKKIIYNWKPYQQIIQCNLVLIDAYCYERTASQYLRLFLNVEKEHRFFIFVLLTGKL